MDQNQNTALSFGCSQCLRRFATKSQVASHCLNAHYLKNALAASASEVNAQCLVLPFRNVQTGRLNKWNCQSCGKVLTSEDAFVNHSRRAHDFGCSHCLQHFIVKLDLVPHILEHLSTRHFCEQFAEPNQLWSIEGQFSFGCCLCLNHFDSKQKLVSHIWKKHNSLSAKFVYCKCCSKSFTSAALLKQHMAKHSAEPLFKCRWCDKTFKFRSNWLQHNCPFRMESSVKRTPWRLNLRPGFKRFRCSVCPFRCALKATLRRHKTIHKRSVTPVPEVKDSVYFACAYCPERFGSLDEKYLHESCIHGEVSLVQCNFCEMEFMDEQTRNDHAQKCHLETAAQCCSSSSSSGTAASSMSEQLLPSGLKGTAATLAHAEKGGEGVLKNERRFSCKFCSQRFLTVDSRARHELSTHLELPMPHECASCAETFITSNQLLVHTRSAHGQAFDCTYCFQSFISSAELSLHLSRKHPVGPAVVQREPSNFPYKCSACAKQFSLSRQLKQHWRYKHEPKFACPQCAKLFVKKCERAFHMAKVHLEFPSGARRSSPPHDHVIASPSNDLKSPQEMSPTVRGAAVSVSSSQNDLACSICAVKFQYPFQLRMHWDFTHEHYACVLCDKTFAGTYHLLHHRKKAHPPHDLVASTQESNEFPESHVTASLSNDFVKDHAKLYPFACIFCEQRFVDAAAADAHISEHDSRYACRYCEQVFDSAVSLAAHVCSKLASNPEKASSPSYRRKDQNGSRRYYCMFCAAKFSDWRAKKQHLVNQHAGNKIKCDFCERSFWSMKMQQAHMRFVHSDVLGPRPYTFACEFCPRQFSCRSWKAAHEKRLHVEHSLPSHKCLRCGAVFGVPMAMRRHARDCQQLPMRPKSSSVCDAPGRIDDVIDAVRAVVGSTPDAVQGDCDATRPSATMNRMNDVIDSVVYVVDSPEAAGTASDGSPYASNAPTSSSSLGQISADQFQFDQAAGAFSLQPNWFQCEFCAKLFCVDANSFQSHVTSCRGNCESMLVSAPFLPLPALQPMPCFGDPTNIPTNACQEQRPGSAELSGLSIDYAAFTDAAPDGSGCFDMPYQTSIIMPCGLCPSSFPAFDLLKLHEASEHRCFECPQMFPNGALRNEHYRLFHVAGASGHVTAAAPAFPNLQSSSLLQSELAANQIGPVSQIASQGYRGNDDDMAVAGTPSNSAHCSNGFGLLMPTASAVASSQPQVPNTPPANPINQASQPPTNQMHHVAQNTSHNHGNVHTSPAESSHHSQAERNCAILSSSGPMSAKILSIQRAKKRSLPRDSQSDHANQASFSFTSANRTSHVTETGSSTISAAKLVFKCDYCADAPTFVSVMSKLHHENEHHRCLFCRAMFPGSASRLVHMTVVHSSQLAGDLPKASSGANAILTSLQTLVRRAGSSSDVPTRGRSKKSRGNDVTPVVDLTQDSDEEEEKI